MLSQAAVSHHLPSAPASQKPSPNSQGCSTHSSLGLRWQMVSLHWPPPPPPPQVRPWNSSRKFGLQLVSREAVFSSIWVEPPCPNMVKSEHTACSGTKNSTSRYLVSCSPQLLLGTLPLHFPESPGKQMSNSQTHYPPHKTILINIRKCFFCTPSLRLAEKPV